jgi:hypothetical protein
MFINAIIGNKQEEKRSIDATWISELSLIDSS